MTLSAGTKLGPYETLSPLGARGMGDTYLAKDTTATAIPRRKRPMGWTPNPSEIADRR